MKKTAPPIDLATVREASRILAALEESFPELHGTWKPAMRRALNEAPEETAAMEKTTLAAFRFPAPLLERIDAYANRMGLSRAAAVRVLVTTTLDAQPGAAPIGSQASAEQLPIEEPVGEKPAPGPKPCHQWTAEAEGRRFVALQDDKPSAGRRWWTAAEVVAGKPSRILKTCRTATEAKSVCQGQSFAVLSWRKD